MSKTRITIETHQIMIIRRQGATRAWCRGCQAQVDTVQVEAISSLAGFSPETLWYWLQDNSVHWSKGLDGSIRICLKSLLAQTEDKAPARLMGLGTKGRLSDQ